MKVTKILLDDIEADNGRFYKFAGAGTVSGKFCVVMKSEATDMYSVCEMPLKQANALLEQLQTYLGLI